MDMKKWNTVNAMYREVRKKHPDLPSSHELPQSVSWLHYAKEHCLAKLQQDEKAEWGDLIEICFYVLAVQDERVQALEESLTRCRILMTPQPHISTKMENRLW